MQTGFKEETSHIKVQLYVFKKIPIKFNIARYRNHKILIEQFS